ncbi:MAG: hypothetical protein WA666_11960 [Nitrospirota bacterium]
MPKEKENEKDKIDAILEIVLVISKKLPFKKLSGSHVINALFDIFSFLVYLLFLLFVSGKAFEADASLALSANLIIILILFLAFFTCFRLSIKIDKLVDK